jgi:hypothetical protein
MVRRFESLCERLLIAGVRPRHVRRYARELSDHLDDLYTAERAAGYDEVEAMRRARAVLGNDDELAEAMIDLREFRSLTARAPWLVFGVLPPFFVVAAMLALAAVLAGVAVLYTQAYGDTAAVPTEFRFLAEVFSLIANYDIGPLTGLLLAVLAVRQRIPILWERIGIALAAFCFAFSTFAIQLPPDGLHGCRLSVGISSDVPFWNVGSRLCLTLAFAVAMHWLLKSRFEAEGKAAADA